MIQKKTIVLAIVLIAIVIIQLNDGLTRKEVREKFRCALQKRRFQLVTSSSTKELNVQVTTKKETSVTDSTTTLASTLTTIFDVPFKLSQSCNKGNLEDNLSIYGYDRIMSK